MRSSSAARTGNLSELAPLAKSYREARKEAGHPGQGEVASHILS